MLSEFLESLLHRLRAPWVMASCIWATTSAECHAPEPWQLGFQEPSTQGMRGLIDLHHDLMAVLLVVLTVVLWMLFRTLWFYRAKASPKPMKIIHGTTIEVIWTLIPCAILVMIALPSFHLLYTISRVVDPLITVKVIGHQWYWSYEYGDYSATPIAYDSYMLTDEDLRPGQLRMLEVDNPLVLPQDVPVRLLITSADVIHSWAVPSFGVKCDALPGRLNEVYLTVDTLGRHYGQCSEICGVNHAAMPIAVEIVPLEVYVRWLPLMLEDVEPLTPAGITGSVEHDASTQSVEHDASTPNVEHDASTPNVEHDTSTQSVEQEPSTVSVE
jgi:cytochrome c oxidase subunit 2